MNARKEVQTINWTLFGVMTLAGLVSAGSTLTKLKNLTPEQETEGQSRFRVHWEQPETILALILGCIILLLIHGWKKLFPFNVPFAMIVGGVWYAFLFQVTTVGWAGLIGFVGLLIAMVAGLLMIIIYAFGARKWGLRRHRE
ncbi:RND transporter [Rossellomorea vietnamensis]|uniref:RND transporter n=1 Tax=Rossellomorea vietnamensis TaxID=218284 RepID=UPI001E44AE96|nr:RND transporter [Rossellomorea vietnamensis]MCC5803933.1 RND transporter [Rossellomorea vietnamensis]